MGGVAGWGPVGIGYVRPVQFLDHLTVIIIEQIPIRLLRILLREYYIKKGIEELQYQSLKYLQSQIQKKLEHLKAVLCKNSNMLQLD